MARDLEEDRSTELLAELAHAMLPDSVAHRRLTSLTFKLTYKIPRVEPGVMMKREKDRILSLRTLPRTFTIPLIKSPTLQP